ncbi:NAD(P)H-binding protein [Puniceicoccaceae bacterium K14]|nr:NAD(P)H-binding protein [Puniceicoccaceae bacterium K14]
MTAKSNSVTKKTILVIGASGKTGRRVMQRLRVADHPVKAASRSGETRFDWNDRETWNDAIKGVDAAYLTFYPDLSFPGAAEIVEDFAKLAVSKGLKRLVLLSGRGEAGAQDAEKRIERSGAAWTVVRCSVFNQNFSEAFTDSIRAGHLSMPVANSKEPFVDTEDIADVVFASLTDDKHIGKLYELTGPRVMDLEEVVTELSDAIGREILFHSVSIEEYAKELIRHGYPEEESRPIAELIADVFDGRNAYVVDGVMQALGRPARDFSDYAKEAAASGVWDREEVMS